MSIYIKKNEQSRFWRQNSAATVFMIIYYLLHSTNDKRFITDELMANTPEIHLRLSTKAVPQQIAKRVFLFFISLYLPSFSPLLFRLFLPPSLCLPAEGI